MNGIGIKMNLYQFEVIWTTEETILNVWDLRFTWIHPLFLAIFPLLVVGMDTVAKRVWSFLENCDEPTASSIIRQYEQLLAPPGTMNRSPQSTTMNHWRQSPTIVIMNQSNLLSLFTTIHQLSATINDREAALIISHSEKSPLFTIVKYITNHHQSSIIIAHKHHNKTPLTTILNHY